MFFRHWSRGCVSVRSRHSSGRPTLRKIVRLLTAVAAVAMFQIAPAAADSAGQVHAAASGVAVTGTLIDTTGKQLGTVAMADEGGKVRVVVLATGLTPGFHGVHIHSVGKCEAPDFSTAGGHYA